MDKESQDLAWACLPKEIKNEIRLIFNMPSKYGYSEGVRRMLVDLYGYNLTSGTEPEEMLTVERRDIINRYKGILAQQDPKNFGYSAYLQGQKDLLESLYASKCVPDKKEQVQPKFSIGEKVRIIDYDRSISSLFFLRNKVCVVKGITSMGMYRLELIDDSFKHIKVNDSDTAEEFISSIQWNEIFLELYTESKPKFNKGDRILWLGKERIIKEIIPGNPIRYGFEGCIGLLSEDQIASCNPRSN